MSFRTSLPLLCVCLVTSVLAGSCGLNYLKPDAREDQEWRQLSSAVPTNAGRGPERPGGADNSVQKPRPLPPNERPIIAVMDIEDRGGALEAQVLDSLTDYLRASLVASGRFSVVDKSRQSQAREKMIKAEKAESYKTCYDRSCQIPLGQALAADSVLSINLGSMGSKLIIRAEIVDLAREVSVSGGVVKCDREPVEGLEERLMESADSLVLQLSR